MLLRSRISCYRLAVATSAVHAALFDRSSGAAACAGQRSDGYAHRGPATNDYEPSTFSKVAGSLRGRNVSFSSWRATWRMKALKLLFRAQIILERLNFPKH